MCRGEAERAVPIRLGLRSLARLLSQKCHPAIIVSSRQYGTQTSEERSDRMISTLSESY